GRVRTREVRVVGCVRHPGRLTRRDDPPREALARGEDEPLAHRLELASAVARVPGADAAEPAVLRIDLPDRADLPAERHADHLQDGCVRFEWLLLLGEDPRDRMLDPLEIESIGDHSLASLEIRHA